MQSESATVPRRDFFPMLAMGFFALPNVIFLLGWVRPEIGVPVALLVTAGVVWFALQKNDHPPRPALTRKSLWLVLIAAFSWTLLVGVGGFLPQSSDQLKHNLVLHDLAALPWPVEYTQGGGMTYLCYALGYYLIPGLAGKVSNEEIISPATFIWTFIGLFLFFWWAVTLTKSPMRVIAAILLFAMTGACWALFRDHGVPGVINNEGYYHRLLNLGLFVDYNDSYNRFHFQPQHALAGWLGTALLYDRIWVQKTPRGAIFILSLCLLWSPFTCIGLIIVPLAAWRQIRWRDYFNFMDLSGIILLGLDLIYFQGHIPLPDHGFIWNFSTGNDWVLFYPLFVLLTLNPLFFIWLLEVREKILKEWRPLFFCSASLLILSPIYRMGFFSDLRLEASATPLLLLALVTVRLVESGKFSIKKPRWLMLAASLLPGIVMSMAHPVDEILRGAPDYSYANIVQSKGWRNLPDMKDIFNVAAQYQGRDDSMAVRRLLKRKTGATP